MPTFTYIKKIKKIGLVLLACLLSACNGFFDKDNTPEPKALTQFKAEIKPKMIWSVKAGDGAGDEYLKMSPAVGDQAIYTAGVKGSVTSISMVNGHLNWRTNTHASLSTGPGAGNGLIVVGSRHGEVIALNENDGSQAWKTSVAGELLANPAISNGHVVIKATDGYIRSLSAKDGSLEWAIQQVEPSLILRASSAPQIRGNALLVGYANGNLAKLSLYNGQLQWMQPIAIAQGMFAIQRMIDIDADPVIYDYRVFAATYQGNIASLDWNTGQSLWSHDISSYTGMVADNSAVFVSDAKSNVWAFGADSGLVNWRQTDLAYRNVSGPAIMGNYVVVGDAEGFLHWLDRRDGHFAAREFAGAAIYTAPIVRNNIVYALTNNGYLVAYRLGTEVR